MSAPASSPTTDLLLALAALLYTGALLLLLDPGKLGEAVGRVVSAYHAAVLG